MSVGAAYGPLLRRGAVRAVLLSRLAGVAGLGVVLALALLLSERSYAAAGIVIGVNAVASALTSPWRGRLLDRHGQPRVLVPLALISTTGFVLIVVAVQAGAPLGLIAVISAITGATRPPMDAALRMLWRDLTETDEELQTGYTLQAIVSELLYALGPLVAGVVAAAASPQAAVIVTAASDGAGALLLAATSASRAWRGRPVTGPAPRVLSPGLLTLLAANLAVGAIFGGLDVAVVAFTTDEGARDLAGVALAVLSLGSIAGGVVYGARTWGGTVRRRLIVLNGAMALSLVPLALAPSVAVFIVLMALAGLAVAPYIAATYRVLDDVTPESAAGEAMSWIVTVYSAGAALGAFGTGLASDHAGARWALALTAVFALAGFAAVLARRATLVP